MPMTAGYMGVPKPEIKLRCFYKYINPQKTSPLPIGLAQYTTTAAHFDIYFGLCSSAVKYLTLESAFQSYLEGEM